MIVRRSDSFLNKKRRRLEIIKNCSKYFWKYNLFYVLLKHPTYTRHNIKCLAGAERSIYVWLKHPAFAIQHKNGNLVSQRFSFISTQTTSVQRFKRDNARHVCALASVLKSLDHACNALALWKDLQFVAVNVSGGWQASSSSENSVCVGFALTEPENELNTMAKHSIGKQAVLMLVSKLNDK